ncbi:MAG: hypothetical protein ISS71_00620 [Phycisphaerae bacterium]|nr:hypothetical protein [Phycisphaerae bacterium]
MENINSEQELRQLLEEGRITEEEYRQLLEAIHKNPQPDLTHNTPRQNNTASQFLFRQVPWQIWVIVFILVWEGIENLFIIPKYPWAIIWILAKILFIVGLLKAWKWVFFLFQIITGIHVLSFGMAGAWLVSFLNLLLMVLAFSAIRYLFPVKTIENSHYPDKGAI